MPSACTILPAHSLVVSRGWGARVGFNDSTWLGRSNVGRAVMISTAFGPLTGGIATPAGTAANLVAIAQLEQLAEVDVSFTRWMLYGVPASILMVPLAWRLLLWLFPPEIERLPFTSADIRAKLVELGPLRPVERNTLVVFGTVIDRTRSGASGQVRPCQVRPLTRRSSRPIMRTMARDREGAGTP